MSGKQENIVRLSDWRLAFPDLFVAKAVKPQDKAKFGAAFLAPPTHPDIAVLNKAITAVAIAKWGEQAMNVLKALIAGNRICLCNGDAKAMYDGYPGNLYLNTRSDRAPLVIDADKSPLNANSGKPYSGCYVNAQVAIWAQDNQHGKRINAQVRGVQFLRDGEAFGSGGIADVDEFDSVDNSADGAAPTTGAEDPVLAGLLG